MNWRVNIYGRRCRVFGYKSGDIAKYDQDYSFYIWPWTNVLAGIERLKKRMTWECEIVLKESNVK